jgi:hypothetical protein
VTSRPASPGITDRSAYDIVTDLPAAEYVVKQRDDRRNRYPGAPPAARNRQPGTCHRRSPGSPSLSSGLTVCDLRVAAPGAVDLLTDLLRRGYGLTWFSVRFGLIQLKAYTKGEHVLHFEATAHNTKHLLPSRSAC